MAKGKKSTTKKTLRKSTKRLSRSVRAKVSSLDVTDVLLIVIVLLVLYFVLVENNNSDKNVADIGLDLDVNVGDTNLGIDTEVVLENDSLRGRLGVNIDNDDAHLIGDLDFGDNNKYGAGAYLKVNEDKYGMNLGYNSKRNKAYLNIGEIEGFSTIAESLQPNPDEVVLVYFYADWCGYCKKFKDTWNTTESKLNNTKINNKTVRCVKVESKNKDIINKYDINGYPTIKLLKSGGPANAVPYEGERTFKALEKFVKNKA